MDIALGLASAGIVVLSFFLILTDRPIAFTWSACVFVLIAIVGSIAGTLLARHRFGWPKQPGEFVQVHLGKMSEGLVRLLKEMAITSEYRDSTLYEKTVDRPDGTWTLMIETQGGQIVAFSKSFSSKHSRFLNRGSREGCGHFFASG